jgi:signal transduction histidine kinase
MMKADEAGKKDGDLTREELLAELGAAREAAKQAELLQKAFVSTMRHELYTPLNAILGFADILLAGPPASLTETQRRQLESIDRAAKRLLGLVGDLIALSKAQAGQLDLAIDEFDLGFSAARAAAEAKAEAERRGLAFELRVGEAGTVLAMGDRRQAELVMRHLFSNAVKFTEGGLVKVEVLRGEGEALVRVTDTGIGITPEDLERIFKPFAQLDSGLTRRYEGAGIGLSVAKLVVEAMGGRILVESEKGRGSTFSLSLPSRQ